MPHIRTQIRTAIAGLLDGLPSTGARVFESRMRPKDDGKLPCLLVTTNDEQITRITIGAPQQERVIDVKIHGFAMANAGLDDRLDQIALEVETALAAQPYFAGVYADLALEAIEVAFDEGLEKPVGRVSLTYQCTTFTAAADPGAVTA